MTAAAQRSEPFRTMAEVEEYLAGDRIECLECGRRLRSLATHLPRIHALTDGEYRARWGIPATAPLAGRATREKLSAGMRQRIAEGRHSLDHLPRAIEAARGAARHPRAPATRALQADIARAIPHPELPPGAARRDGRDAERAREYQRARRAQLAGQPDAMARYRERWPRR